MTKTSEPLLTLEPLIEAVRDGVSGDGWELSGLQKTTSHQFEGRWDGESSRSAYLFFHSEAFPDFVSIDVFLDETNKGLRGNLALVVAGPELSELGPMEQLLSSLPRSVPTVCLPGIGPLEQSACVWIDRMRIRRMRRVKCVSSSAFPSRR